MMVRAANLLAEARRIPGMAGTVAASPDWAPVDRRIRAEATDNWNDKVAVDRFTGKGGHFVRGRATITGVSAHTHMAMYQAGLTEAQAREQGIDVRTAPSRTRSAAWTGKSQRPDTGRAVRPP
jgi:hypothetical protein